MSQEDEAPRHAPVQDLSAEPPPPLAPPAGSRPASPPPEARQPLSAAELEEECRLLELENACLLQLLQRVAPDSLRLGHEASADGPAPADGPGPEPLLLAEKQELCAAEAAAVRQAIERTQQEGELEAACAAAALTDCQVQQAGEVLRDATALLTLLGLPVEPEPAAASGSIPEQPAGADGEPGQQEGQAPAAPAGPAPSPLGLRLPTAKQLARAQLNGAQLEGLLEGMLERQDAAAERLRLRGAMLKARLGKVEAQLAARAEEGAALKRVDYDVLSIEHSQAEAGLAVATAEAIQLKAQVAAAQQFLADQRAALGEAAGACVALRKQAGARGAQLAQLRAEAARLGRECARVEAECARLRAERGGAARSDKTEGGVAAGASPPAASAKSAGGDSVLEYMRLKSACAEAERRVRDWERKLEVQAGRAAAAGRR